MNIQKKKLYLQKEQKEKEKKVEKKIQLYQKDLNQNLMNLNQ